MKKYNNPELEITYIKLNDVLSASSAGNISPEEDETPTIGGLLLFDLV